MLPLLQIWRRQFEAWRALPADDDGLRHTVADLSWEMTSVLLDQFRPTTVAGAVAALRHVVDRLKLDHPAADSDYYPIPLADRAVTTLERLAAP